MGAWGEEAFASDAALDWVGDNEPMNKNVILSAISLSLNESTQYQIHAASEIIAAASAQKPYWQEEGTTIFSPGSKEFFPKEVVDWLEYEKPAFDGLAINAALKSLDQLKKEEYLLSWRDPRARFDAIDATQERLREALVIQRNSLEVASEEHENIQSLPPRRRLSPLAQPPGNSASTEGIEI